MRKLTREEYETLKACLPEGSAIRGYGHDYQTTEDYLAIATWGDEILKEEKKTFLLLGVALAKRNSTEANNLIEALSNAKMHSAGIAKSSKQTYFTSIQLPDEVLAEDED